MATDPKIIQFVVRDQSSLPSLSNKSRLVFVVKNSVCSKILCDYNNVRYSFYAVQGADWQVSDASSGSYIKNKPFIPTDVSQLSDASGLLQVVPKAKKLQTPVTISLTGGVTGSTTFDGSANVSIQAIVQASQLQINWSQLIGTKPDLGIFSNNAMYAKVSQIPTDVSQLSDAYQMLVRADWNQSDSQQYSFIRNKPFIPYDIAQLSDSQGILIKAGKQADWNESNSEERSFILNKPFVATDVSQLSDAYSLLANADWDQSDSSLRSFILNKPFIPTDVSQLSDAYSLLANADWNQSNSSQKAYIKNKPFIPTDLSQLSDSQGILSIQADWNESNSAQRSFILNKPFIPTDLSQLSDSQGILVRAGKQADWNESNSAQRSFILNKPFIPTDISQLSDSQQLLNSVQSDWSQSSVTSKAYIRNKPLIPTDIAQLSDSQGILSVQSDWNQSNSAQRSFILNKPFIPTDISELSDSRGILVKAGKQADWNQSNSSQRAYIKNKPLIPTDISQLSDSQQLLNSVQSDWNVTDITSKAFIKNKPNVATDVSQLSDAQNLITQSDWNQQDTDSNAYIKNKPNIPTDVSQLSDAYSLIAQSDWNQTDQTNNSYIKNKPTGLSSFTNDSGYVTAAGTIAKATNANKLTTARTISLIGDITTDIVFDGSNNVSAQATLTKTIPTDIAQLSDATGLLDQVQANWNQSDITKPAYIMNKPQVPSYKGVWSSTTIYAKNSLVIYDSKAWLAKKEVQAVVPGTQVGNAYWQLFSSSFKINQIDADAQLVATVQQTDADVSTSGTQFQKNMHFHFKLPRGQKGESTHITGVTAIGTCVDYGSPAKADVSSSGSQADRKLHFSFQIPRGQPGQAFDVDETGSTSEGRHQWDHRQKGFAYLDVTTGLLYIKKSSDSGDWNPPVQFRGLPGGFGTISCSAQTVAYGTAPVVTFVAVPSSPSTAKDFKAHFQIPAGKAASINSITAQAITLAQDSDAYATVSDSGQDPSNRNVHFHFGIPKGKAAGFGTATGTVQMLQPSQSASITITASGQNEAKNFAFNFKIPRGVKGDTGDTGETGSSAGFGTISCSAQTVAYGTAPQVTFTAVQESPQTAKQFKATFKIPAGPQGQTGLAAGFSDSMSVVTTTLAAGQQAEVSVTPIAQSPDTAKKFKFQFKIPTGSQGQAAGIGTATADITTLGPSQSASVSVTTSGPNTQKVFNFHFSIPKGKAAGFGTTTGTVTTLASDSQAEVYVTTSGQQAAKNFTFDFRVPRGFKGDRGQAFSVDATGTLSQRSSYDDQQKGFAFLDITTGQVYFKNSSTHADWSDPVQFKGQAAGFGEISCSAQAVAYGTKPVVTFTAVQSSPSTAKQFQAHFQLPKGQTGDAAKFATIDAVAQTLQAGSAAYATVSDSGSDTSKNFHFKFGIPAPKQPKATAKVVTMQDVSNSYIIVSDANVPVMLQIDSKGYCIYNCQHDTVNHLFKLFLPTYLAADNKSSMTGTWKVWFGGGVRGQSGLDAGFGQFSCSTQTVPTGQPASVTVQQSGPSTAKNLHFSFQIPKGQTGAVTVVIDPSDSQVAKLSDGTLVIYTGEN